MPQRPYQLPSGCWSPLEPRDRAPHRLESRDVTECASIERQRAQIGGRRIEQRAVIGEWDVVEIVIVVVGIGTRRAAIMTLQADDPFARAVDRGIEDLPRSARAHGPRHHDHRV